MIPEILRQLNGNNLGQIKNMMRLMRASRNPQAAVQELMRSNPQMQQAALLIQQAGNDPKRAFYELARQKGADPEAILRELQE